MNLDYYKQYEPIDGKWYITKELGAGSFGRVFEIERQDFHDMKAALKVISVPVSQSEVDSYREDNYELDEKSVTSYFYGFVEDFIKEFRIMSQLKGNSNIVSYEDHDIKNKANGEFGWDIFIRMELLTPMNKFFANNKPRKNDVIRLGIDICTALELCQKHQIIHRDIKPSNIFVSSTGDFKLGDFGVARTLEKTSSGLSKKGTYTYMAPEVFKGDAYGSDVDIYSLGIVMYRLLNNNLEPFRNDKSYSDGEHALEMRMKGTKLPKPANADGRLAEIVLKACSYDPNDRYNNPTDMKKDLESALFQDISDINLVTDEETTMNEEGTVSMFSIQMKHDLNTEKTVSLFDNESEYKPDSVAENCSAVLGKKQEGANQVPRTVHNDSLGVPMSSGISTNNSISHEDTKKVSKKLFLIIGAASIVLIFGICILLMKLGAFGGMTDSGWSGFAHVYSVESDGRIVGDNKVNNANIHTYGDIFEIDDYKDESYMNNVVASSSDNSKRG